MKKQETEIRFKMRNRFSVTHLVLQSSLKIMESQGYIILPATQIVIKENITKAVKRGFLKNESEICIATTALVAGAVTAAKQAETKRVTTRHFSEGWKDHIKVIPGNCPPYKCVLRSTVERENNLLASNRIFQSLLQSIKKG